MVAAGKQHCSIDILHRILGSGKHHRKWNAWKTDDTTLDWNGPEVQQGSWQGQLALGTPAVWTESEESRPGYHALNRYMYMYDCDAIGPNIEQGRYVHYM